MWRRERVLDFADDASSSSSSSSLGSTTVTQEHEAQQQPAMRQDSWPCIFIPVAIWFFASMTLILGLYGSSNLELGPNCSHLLRANSLFLSEIDVSRSTSSDGQLHKACIGWKLEAQVEEKQAESPMLYGFRTKPPLENVKKWSYAREIILEADYHLEWAFWLNKGSKVELEYKVLSNGFLDVVIAALQGREGLSEWKADPNNPSSALSWHTVHGNGNMSFQVDKDDEYILAFGNLNLQDLKMEVTLKIFSKSYSTENAFYSCKLQDHLCGLKLLFPGSTYALLTTPDIIEPGTASVWHIKLSYDQRWATYLVSLGAVLVLSTVALKLFDSLSSFPEEDNSERAPLLNKQACEECQERPTSNPNAIASSSTDEKLKEVYSSYICAICYDQPRTSFFDPCSHCATCYACALRCCTICFLLSCMNNSCNWLQNNACRDRHTTMPHLQKRDTRGPQNLYFLNDLCSNFPTVFFQ